MGNPSRLGFLRFYPVFFLILPFLLASCEPVPKKLLQSAEKRLEDGDFLGAVNSYEYLIEQYPRSDFLDDAYFAIGTIERLYLGNHANAILAFRTVAESFPGGTLAQEAQLILGEIYEKKYGDSRRAIAEYQKYLEITSDKNRGEEVRFRIGRIYFEQGEFEQARNEWSQLTAQTPASEWADNAVYHTANSLFLQDRHEKARSILENAIQRYPESDVLIEMKYSLGSALEELGRTEEAIQAFRKIKDDYPNPGVIGLKIQNLERLKEGKPKELPVPEGHPASGGR